MIKGADAKTHAIETTGDKSIDAVAIAFPRGTTREQAGGMAIGGVAGAAAGAAASLGSCLAGRLVAGASGGLGVGSLATNIHLDRSEAPR